MKHAGRKYQVTEAAERLGVSRTKLWQMIRDEQIPYHPDPLDGRRKLIDGADIDALLSRRGIMPEGGNPAGRSRAGVRPSPLSRAHGMTRGTDATLRGAALSAYYRLCAERFEERERYKGMAFKDALRLKLDRVLGGRYDVVFGAGGNEWEQFAEIDGLRFLGVRLPGGDVGFVWVVRCVGCGEEKGGDFIDSLADLGEEISEFGRTGRPGGHRCPSGATDLPVGTPAT